MRRGKLFRQSAAAADPHSADLTQLPENQQSGRTQSKNNSKGIPDQDIPERLPLDAQRHKGAKGIPMGNRIAPRHQDGQRVERIIDFLQ